MAPNWDDIYRDKFNESSKGFDEQRKQYQDAQAAEQAALDKQRDTASKRAQQELERASQEAYIARTMAGKKMPQMLAAQGISGGMTETTASNIFRDYLRSKSAADASYNTAMSDLQNSYMTNSSTLKSSWAQKQAELDQQQRSQAMEQAKFAYEIALKEEERRKQEEEERKRQEEAERQQREAAARTWVKSKNTKKTDGKVKKVSYNSRTGEVYYTYENGKIKSGGNIGNSNRWRGGPSGV